MTETQPPPTPTDALMKYVILVLGAGFILAVLGIVALAWVQRPVPDVLQNIAVGALGVLGALLAGRRQT